MRKLLIVIATLSVSLIGSLTAKTTDIRVSVHGPRPGPGGADALIDPIYVKYLRNLPGVTVVPDGDSCDFTIMVNALKITTNVDNLRGYVWASDVVDANYVLVRGMKLQTSHTGMPSVEESVSEEVMELEPKVFRPFRQSSTSTTNK